MLKKSVIKFGKVMKVMDIIKKIYDYSLEEIMGERFGKYSK